MKIILTPEEREIWTEAWRRWGPDHQTVMACEETSETITAVTHFARGRVPIEKVIEEFADAFVCVGQVIHSELRFNDGDDIEDVLNEMIIYSFLKLQKKLEENDKNHGANR